MDYNLNVLGAISVLGIAGNLISLGIFTRKKFDKFNARDMFIVCLVVETLCLLLTLFAVVTNIRLTSLYCKIYYSLGFILPAYSSWILVFISLGVSSAQLTQQANWLNLLATNDYKW